MKVLKVYRLYFNKVILKEGDIVCVILCVSKAIKIPYTVIIKICLIKTIADAMLKLKIVYYISKKYFIF